MYWAGAEREADRTKGRREENCKAARENSFMANLVGLGCTNWIGEMAVGDLPVYGKRRLHLLGGSYKIVFLKFLGNNLNLSLCPLADAFRPSLPLEWIN